MRNLFVSLLFLFVLTACTPTPRLVEHPDPELKANTTFFADLGCFSDTGCQSKLPAWPHGEFSMVEEPRESLGGLDPALPIAMLWTFSSEPDPSIPAIFSGSCAFSHYYTYLVYRDGKIENLASREEFQKVFAPIESKNEALGYAVALTGYMAVYDLESIKGIEIRTPMLHETYVRKVKGGYVVHLFDFFLCHCGPFYINSVDVTVYRDGTLDIADPVEAYRNPADDMSCID